MPAGRPSEYNQKILTPCRFNEKQQGDIADLGYTITVDNSSLFQYPHYPTLIFSKN